MSYTIDKCTKRITSDEKKINSKVKRKDTNPNLNLTNFVMHFLYLANTPKLHRQPIVLDVDKWVSIREFSEI